ncbi:unnamed protein product [Brassica oleracea]
MFVLHYQMQTSIKRKRYSERMFRFLVCVFCFLRAHGN